MQGRMQGRILEKFGSEAYVRSQGHMQGHILEEFGSGDMQGHMQGCILEEFGSGACGAKGTCSSTLTPLPPRPRQLW